MKKAITMLLLAAIVGSFPVHAEMSETRRGTFNGIEWLYTIDSEARRLVLEKAILLTADQYSMDMDLSGILLSALADGGIYHTSGDWDIWFGASAFESNTYLSGIGLNCLTYGRGVDGDTKLNVTICENAFKNSSIGYLDSGSKYDDSPTIRVVSINDSAFENCNVCLFYISFYFLFILPTEIFKCKYISSSSVLP